MLRTSAPKATCTELSEILSWWYFLVSFHGSLEGLAYKTPKENRVASNNSRQLFSRVWFIQWHFSYRSLHRVIISELSFLIPNFKQNIFNFNSSANCCSQCGWDKPLTDHLLTCNGQRDIFADPSSNPPWVSPATVSGTKRAKVLMPRARRQNLATFGGQKLEVPKTGC